MGQIPKVTKYKVTYAKVIFISSNAPPQAVASNIKIQQSTTVLYFSFLKLTFSLGEDEIRASLRTESEQLIAMQTASATWQVKQAAMFINVTETDDLIHYGSNCSPVPLRFPDLGCKGKRTGFSASRGVRAAFSLLGSVLRTLFYSAVQMFQETSIRFTWLSHCVQLAFWCQWHMMLGHISQVLLSATLCMRQSFSSLHRSH